MPLFSVGLPCITTPIKPSDDLDLIDLRRVFYRSPFDWCLDRADDCSRIGNDEAAIRWLLIAARSAGTLGCGRLVAPKLESIALMLGARLGRGLPDAHTAPQRPARLRWLRVISVVNPWVASPCRMRSQPTSRCISIGAEDDLKIRQLRRSIDGR